MVGYPNGTDQLSDINIIFDGDMYLFETKKKMLRLIAPTQCKSWDQLFYCPLKVFIDFM